MRIKRYQTKDTTIIIEGFDNRKCNLCNGYNTDFKVCFDCKNNSNLYLEERILKSYNHIMKLKFELSNKQKEASKFFLDHLKNKENAFLKAICGSGKTEILYETILYSLNNDLKVIIVIPRIEIVKELYIRLKDIFINTRIKYLDGLHHDDDAELLISTVNQLINYKEEFDLIILDEADAFPYSSSDYLHRLVKKALKKDGVLFMMSATEKERIKEDRFTINRRYHNENLSMPHFIKYKYSILENNIFNDLIKNKNRKFIIYTKSIKDAYELSLSLNCPYVTSKTKNSRLIIDSFKTNNQKLLVSTTILERGITVNNLDVIVIDADNEVFNHQTLIQISGRVGRSFEDKKGDIYIFYRRNSFKFFKVRKYIKKMNEM